MDHPNDLGASIVVFYSSMLQAQGQRQYFYIMLSISTKNSCC